MNFLIGIILIIVGILLIKYRYPIYHFTGDWSFAQQYLGANGTVVAISLIGAGLIFVGVAFPLGAFNKEEISTGTGSVQVQNANYFSQ